MCYWCVCVLQIEETGLVSGVFSSTVTCVWLPITVTVSSSFWRWTYSPRDCVHALIWWYLRSFFWSAQCESSEGESTWWLFEPWNFGPKWTSWLPQELKDASNWQLKLFEMGEMKGRKLKNDLMGLRYFLAWDTLLQKYTRLLLMSFIALQPDCFLGSTHNPQSSDGAQLRVMSVWIFIFCLKGPVCNINRDLLASNGIPVM